MHMFAHNVPTYICIFYKPCYFLCTYVRMYVCLVGTYDLVCYCDIVTLYQCMRGCDYACGVVFGGGGGG